MVAGMMAETSSLPVANEALVRQYARELAKRTGTATESHTLALRAQPSWLGPAEFDVTDSRDVMRTVQVVACISPLAVREAMTQRTDLLVVITDQLDSELGLGILARCFDQRIVTPDMWEAVKGSFRARQVDSILKRMAWIAEPLVALAPVAGWPVAPGGTLTRDHALTNLTAAILGVPISDLDPSGILAWTMDPSGSAQLRAQPKKVQDDIIDWVRSTIDPVAAIALRSSIQQHSIDALTLGLVADVLWDSQSQFDPEVVAARTRLEQFTGVTDLDNATARSFADSVRGAIQRMAQARDPARPGVLARATELFTDLRYPTGAAVSLVLPAGFDARLHSLAEVVHTFLADGCVDLVPVESAFADLMGHDLAASDPRKTRIPRMAVRLARWLATPEAAPATDLEQALMRQARELAFVDWAASDVWVGSTDPLVAAAWSALFQAAHSRRSASDRRFAELLAAATSTNVLPDSLVPVERVIANTLAPLAAAGNRLLIILIDGMSTSVAAELADEAAHVGWFEAVPKNTTARTTTLAVLPTLTRYSRTSFFCGSLTAGGQTEERNGFATLSGGGTVFHKADLVAEAGHALSTDVLRAISSTAPMVATVLNTVDDALSKADPGGMTWTLESIQHLQPLLDQASQAGRTVVLISDHGHVVERGGQALSIAGAEARFRPLSSGPVDPILEVQLSGPRVLAAGGALIAAVSEDIRYTTKQAGYHGGASAAEVTIPIIVLSRQPDELQAAGWVAAPPQIPFWWNDTITSTIGTKSLPPTPGKRPAKKTQQDVGQASFDIEVVESPVTMEPTDHNDVLLNALMSSPMYAAQKKRYGARAADDSTVRSVLIVLLRQSGRAHRDTLAAAASIPVGRMTGTLTALRRQLNIEGYEVLATDVDAVTVTLNEALLREQFLEDAS